MYLLLTRYTVSQLSNTKVKIHDIQISSSSFQNRRFVALVWDDVVKFARRQHRAVGRGVRFVIRGTTYLVISFDPVDKRPHYTLLPARSCVPCMPLIQQRNGCGPPQSPPRCTTHQRPVYQLHIIRCGTIKG